MKSPKEQMHEYKKKIKEYNKKNSVAQDEYINRMNNSVLHGSKELLNILREGNLAKLKRRYM